jgi:hypothetical protein
METRARVGAQPAKDDGGVCLGSRPGQRHFSCDAGHFSTLMGSVTEGAFCAIVR